MTTATVTKKIGEDLSILIQDEIIVVPPPPVIIQEPFKLMTIPGRIEAEFFDKGGEGKSYHDVDPENKGNSTIRAAEGVDIETDLNTGISNIGYIVAGEWWKWTVEATEGKWKFGAAVASVTNVGKFKVEMDGVEIAQIVVPNTGDWKKYQFIQGPEVQVAGGKREIKITAIEGNFNLDYTEFSPISTIPPVITTPIGGITSGVVEAIKTAGEGRTVLIGNVEVPMPIIDNVPAGVEIKGSGATYFKATVLGTESSGVKKSIFNTIGPGPRKFTNFGMRGANIGYSGIKIMQADLSKINNVTFEDFNFNGAWGESCKGLEITDSKFINSAWSGANYLSGAINIRNLVDPVIKGCHFSSNKNNKGTGIEALWKYPDNPNKLSNLKILNNTFRLSHQNPWNNGASRNFSIELHNTIYDGIEIGNNDIGNEISLASHMPGTGKLVWVHHNIARLGGDHYFLENIHDDLLSEFNDVEGAFMLSSNTQRNSKWKNHIWRNNRFVSSGALSWGGIFLFGAAGVENVNIHSNDITPKGNVLTKFMGTVGGVTVGVNTLR